jgi:hypothetical protein
MWSTLNSHYNNLVEAIIRPPRDSYALYDLGPTRFRIGGIIWRRRDIDLVNARGLTLKCSHYIPGEEDMIMWRKT